MASFSIPVLVLFFLAATGMVWWAGNRLSNTTDSIFARLDMDDAFGGLIVIAIVANLPDLAIVVTAAFSGDLGIASGNLLGGVAIQVVVLAVLDMLGGRSGPPLTSRTRTLVPVLEAVMVIFALGLVVLGAQMDPITWGRVEPVALLLPTAWLLGLLLIQRANKTMAWELDEDEPQPPAGEENPEIEASKGRLAFLLGVSAALTLIGGVVLERTSSAMADQFGMDGVVFGATILAAATSVPDLATGFQSAKLGNNEMLISQVFGAVAFLPSLFLVANVIAGQAVLPSANGTNLYLAAFGIVLMCVYVVGLLVRSQRSVLRMGLDSWLVLAIYAVGMYGLIFTD